jgi:hypothetical protein
VRNARVAQERKEETSFEVMMIREDEDYVVRFGNEMPAHDERLVRGIFFVTADAR